jgi:hypothetical protein
MTFGSACDGATRLRDRQRKERPPVPPETRPKTHVPVPSQCMHYATTRVKTAILAPQLRPHFDETVTYPITKRQSQKRLFEEFFYRQECRQALIFPIYALHTFQRLVLGLARLISQQPQVKKQGMLAGCRVTTGRYTEPEPEEGERLNAANTIQWVVAGRHWPTGLKTAALATEAGAMKAETAWSSHFLFLDRSRSRGCWVRFGRGRPAPPGAKEPPQILALASANARRGRGHANGAANLSTLNRLRAGRR